MYNILTMTTHITNLYKNMKFSILLKTILFWGGGVGGKTHVFKTFFLLPVPLTLTSKDYFQFTKPINS